MTPSFPCLPNFLITSCSIWYLQNVAAATFMATATSMPGKLSSNNVTFIGSLYIELANFRKKLKKKNYCNTSNKVLLNFRIFYKHNIGVFGRIRYGPRNNYWCYAFQYIGSRSSGRNSSSKCKNRLSTNKASYLSHVIRKSHCASELLSKVQKCYFI